MGNVVIVRGNTVVKQSRGKTWRDASYVNQAEEEGLMPVRNSHRFNRSGRKFLDCEKKMARNLATGDLTCCIIFPSGKVKIGDDVWRLSCLADYCEYPFRSFMSVREASSEYSIEEAPGSMLLTDGSEEDGLSEIAY